MRAEIAHTGVSVSTVLPGLVQDTELSAGVKLPGAVSVEAADIALAVVGTVRNRRDETAVPGWLGLATATSNLFPEAVLSRAGQALGTHSGLDANDTAERASYLKRVAEQSVGQTHIT